jgi:hypothetical protein
MWVIEAWDKAAKGWSEIGRDEHPVKTKVVVKLAADKGFVCRATHPTDGRMTAYPHRGFYHYRLLEKQDEVPTDS